MFRIEVLITFLFVFVNELERIQIFLKYPFFCLFLTLESVKQQKNTEKFDLFSSNIDVGN